jgi:hypothetical protein
VAKPKAIAKLADLAGKAGRWLGLQAPARHTGAVESDRFDDMTWRDVTGQAAAVRELIEDLGERHDYAADLVRDMFLAAYKASPVVRPAGDMHPSRLVNRQAIAGLLASPEFAELRRETVGDPYASAMAVLAQAEAMRRMLEQAADAQQAADQAARAAQDEQEAAEAVAAAMEQAAAQAGEDGSVPGETAGAVEAAIEAAGQAGERAQAAAQALAGAALTLSGSPRAQRLTPASSRMAMVTSSSLSSPAGPVSATRISA